MAKKRESVKMTQGKKNIYAAIGNSGNVIYVNSEKDIVISATSYFKPTIFDRVDFIQEYFEPFISEIKFQFTEVY